MSEILRLGDETEASRVRLVGFRTTERAPARMTHFPIQKTRMLCA